MSLGLPTTDDSVLTHRELDPALLSPPNGNGHGDGDGDGDGDGHGDGDNGIDGHGEGPHSNLLHEVLRNRWERLQGEILEFMGERNVPG